MNKPLFLDDEEVKPFRAWLRKVINDDDGYCFRHSYEVEARGRGRRRSSWQCEGIYEAYEKYGWQFTYTDRARGNRRIAGGTFQESAVELDKLSEDLRDSLEEGNIEGCFHACVSVLDWGGVLGSVNSGNMQKISLIKPYIHSYLKCAKNYLEDENVTMTASHIINTKNTEVPLIMNAGFTKIYSILCSDFVIYDGRVGAAIGMLVRKYCEETEKNIVPEKLNFLYGKAKNNKISRNPSGGELQFGKLSSNMGLHTNANLKANWIIEDLLSGECGAFADVNNPSRAIEAALFMIGYKVPHSA